MPKLIPVKEAKARFSDVVNQARYQGEQFLVTKRDIPWAVIIGAEAYEDLIEKIEIMSEQLDPAFQASLEQSMAEYRKGDVGSIADIQAILKSKRQSKNY